MANKLPLIPGEQPYNPLDKDNLAISIAEALLRREIYPLDLPIRFRGAGVYAIYYTGPFPEYAPLTELNRDGRFRYPIYVGKAEPKGQRKGIEGESEGTLIFSRLNQHANSISEVPNLRIAEFFCRYIVVDLAFVTLAERLLISKYRPLWNTVVQGFGINDPGEGRERQKRSEWDTIHPGRRRAEGRPPNQKSAADILADITAHLARVTDPIKA
jgi:hypothetical protein